LFSLWKLVAQSCQTVYDPMDCSPPDSLVCGISQARILEWVAFLFSKGSFQPRDWTCSLALQVDFTIWATKEALDSTNKVVLNILVLIHIIFSLFWVRTRNSPGSKLLSHREDISLIVQEIVKHFPKVVELEFQLFHVYVSIWCCQSLIVAILQMWVGFPGGLYGKEFICMQETEVRSLAWKDPLEKEMATHSSTLAWRIPWAEEPDGLQVVGSQSWTDWATNTHLEVWWYPTVVLIFISLMTNNVEHIFMHLLLIHCDISLWSVH